ncbi:uncharacterized protein FIBRA_05494 [Fibroporia radiculosa]|uniref:JmjC domain-containing protein n=1 Tax=Fibroporia radiculosa TaxID=599839 RepID=J4GR46_9APHY|nr:uncharacterized protein FIBRA_05494 [Fibroporia radiculosa]CCM03365.1 predicted protein [Fibroporia radiculosa]
MDVNALHDAHAHKRTSINELLNPITAPAALDHYNPTQLPSLASFLAPHHLQPGPAPYPSAASSFSLRAASWDHAAKDGHRPDSDPNACRYAPPSHPLYQDSFSRPPRPLDEAPSYGIDVPTWPPSAEPPNSSYPPPALPSIYSDERTGNSHLFPITPLVLNPHPIPAGSTQAAPKNYPPQQHQHQHQHQHPHQYEQDMAQQYTAANVWQTTERASLRIAARGSMQMPVHMQPPPRGQGSPAAYYAPPVAFAIPYQQPPPPMPKRALESVEEDAIPKANKKPKPTKAKPAEGTASSRRGYNAKKRSEAAQIVAQNAQLMTTVSYAHVSNEKGKEKATAATSQGAMRVVSDGVIAHQETSGPLHPELQFARCMSNRYRSEEFPRCVSCTRRWAGDTCRFQGIRFFLKNEQKAIVGISFVESQKPDAPSMNFPNKWNISLEKQHIRRIKRTVAMALLPTLKKELEHLSLNEIIRRPRESEVRATCDTCMTSIFSSSWMCRLCGREACAECYDQVRELTIDRAGAPEAEIAALQARREKHAHVNPFFLSCTRRNEHQAKDFSPMSRFCRSELADAIAEMEAMLQDRDHDALLPELGTADASLSTTSSHSADWSASTPGSEISGVSNVDYTGPHAYSAASGVSMPPDPSSFTAGSMTPQMASGYSPVPTHETLHFTDLALDEQKFRRVWARGDPLVVTGLASKFHVNWSPDYFTSKYGSQSCLILECQTEQNKRVTVGEFFSWFGKYEGRRDCWKLKDWPPSTDFRTAFPELYDDFSNATPVPNYVRRDGVLNLASHFPGNTVAPDLGPKMYNAMASFESQGSKGTTRLHMDMADAINIMLYAASTPDGRPGSAAWDIFKAEDSVKLRKFLRKKFKGQFQHDPIHSQQFYLDSNLRQELFKDYGVKSHRIYQKPGEAVFIPAGCAHQASVRVCNLADCIKVASDFVSPENIERCEMLTREFREQNQSMAWKEDVLQLRTMMWFAWLSCCRQEKDMDA